MTSYEEAEDLLIQQIERKGDGEADTKSAKMQMKTIRLKDKRTARVFLVIEV